MLIVHGKSVVVIDGRLFAIRKTLDNAERIANQTRCRGNSWEKQMRMPKTARLIHSR